MLTPIGVNHAWSVKHLIHYLDDFLSLNGNSYRENSFCTVLYIKVLGILYFKGSYIGFLIFLFITLSDRY